MLFYTNSDISVDYLNNHIGGNYYDMNIGAIVISLLVLISSRLCVEVDHRLEPGL